MKLRLLVFIVLFTLSIITYGQLSDLHYLPPLKQQSNNQAIQQQAIYLSTPSITAFTVNIYRGTSATILKSFSLSKATPIKYTLANGDNNITLVSNANTGVVLTNSGLRLEAPSGSNFYVNYRGRSAYQAASLTSKGRSALGTKFKWGGTPIRSNHYTINSALGIMATLDNTVVTISGYNPNCTFRLQNAASGITANTVVKTLNAGESYVLEAIKSETDYNISGWLGATIMATKDIAISNGMLNFGLISNKQQRDAGIDQPVPEDKIGKEYVFIRGNGGNSNEFPVIIATQDNTEVFVNGNAIPITTLNNGSFFEIPGSNYNSSSVGGNMLVTTSKNAYAYQVTSGASGTHTIGLNFIAPMNCLLPSTMDHIANIKDIAGINANGGITIIASTSTPNTNIIVKDNNGIKTLPTSRSVTGSSDWKTFYISNLIGEVSVQSSGPIAVGFLGYNGSRGIAGYFSGFDTLPNTELEVVGTEKCLPAATMEIKNEIFDHYQWYKNGTIIAGATTSTFTPTEAGSFYVIVTKGSCTFESPPFGVYSCSVITNRRVTYRVRKN